MIHEIELKRRGISVDNFNDTDFSGSFEINLPPGSDFVPE